MKRAFGGKIFSDVLWNERCEFILLLTRICTIESAYNDPEGPSEEQVRKALLEKKIDSFNHR